jgi:hypothetical protein
MPFGSRSRCGKHGRTPLFTNSCCSITIRSLAATWFGGKGNGNPASAHCFSQSVAECGVAERWVGSCRRDLLDDVIIMNERHLKRLMAEYVRYYHEDRTHLGLRKDTPAGPLSANHPAIGSSIRSLPRLGGLHHRYAVAA